MSTVNFKLVVLMVVLCVAVTHAATVKFDFGPMGDTATAGDVIAPAPGHIGVDHTAMYGLQNYMGLDYGFTMLDDPDAAIGSSEKSAWFTSGSPTNLALDYVWVAEGFFELEVPNGEYTVTMGGGNAGWDENTIKSYTEGTEYGSSNPGANNTNVYILDVCPTYRIDGGTTLTWNLEDIEVHDTLGGYGFETWGANNAHGPEPYLWHMEIGYLQEQTITVTDGRLTTNGFKYDVGKLCFLEVTGDGIPVPEPATMVLLSLGGLLLRRRK